MKYLITLCFAVAFMTVAPQNKTFRAAFWNLENLFDTINAPAAADNEFTPQGVRKWTSAKYANKTETIRQVIAALNADLLGVCEVENREVVEDILLQGYDYIHFDSPDIRGIDVALLYKSDKATIESTYTIKALGSQPTRDILVANMITEGKPLRIIVAHLPSKRSKNAKTQAQRQQIIAQIDSLTRDVENVIVCGDFNQNPTAEIMPALYNATAEAYRQGKGSYAYGDVWHMYDQILVSNPLRCDASVFVRAQMVQQSGRFKGYPAKSSPSDHFPVYIDFVVKK